MLKKCLRALCSALFRVQVKGLAHYPTDAPRALIVANHTSFLDAVLLWLYLPVSPVFAVNAYIATRPWVRVLTRWVRMFPMDPTNPMALKSFIQMIKQDSHAVIFPEGRITVTGALMKVYDGPALAALKTEAAIVPVHIEGAQYSIFSRLKGKTRRRLLPQISLTIFPTTSLEVNPELKGRARRHQAGQQLSVLLRQKQFAGKPYSKTLYQALLDARQQHGSDHVICEDIQRQPLNYRQFIMRTQLLARHLPLQQGTAPIGLLLPNSQACAVSFMALQYLGRIPAMLNFTLGAANLSTCMTTAGIQQVITSRQFVLKGKLDDTIEQLAQQAEIIYLEDIAPSISALHKLGAWAKSYTPWSNITPSDKIAADSAAVILFTSGSEGAPKAVLLSHNNILSNIQQLACVIDFNRNDIVLNALPMFHSFGLSSATLLPLLNGVKTFYYPSPLHYRIVPELAYDLNATILFGTNTFFKGYARYAHGYDFFNIRYAFAGAEKLQDDVRQCWAEQFGVRILEGYGATETSPVIAANSPVNYRAGTVGQLLPGIEYQLQSVPGIEQGGRLFVKGPNVMLGYYLADNPQTLVPPVTEFGAGWYDTGDIVTLDEDGFVRIQGRAKRFAKIGGEMVSLSFVETLFSRVWPDAQHAVISVADAQKGEQLIAYTEQRDADKKVLLQYAREQGISEIHIPKTIQILAKLPLLGTGKIDYKALQQSV